MQMRLTVNDCKQLIAVEQKEEVSSEVVLLNVVIYSSSVALQPGVGLGLLYNLPPSLSIPCSISPFIYSRLSQVRGHVIQPSHFWSSSSSCGVTSLRNANTIKPSSLCRIFLRPK